MNKRKTKTKAKAKAKTKRKSKGGRPAHKPTEQQRGQVRHLAAIGVPAQDIAEVIGISRRSLYTHYKEDLQGAAVKANAQIAGYLFAAAKKGNVTAQIFWLKTRAGWRERPDLHEGDDGPKRPRRIIVNEIAQQSDDRDG